MAKFNVKEKDKIIYMRVDEMNERLILLSLTKIYLYKFEKEWACESIKIETVDASIKSLFFKNDILIDAKYKDEEL